VGSCIRAVGTAAVSQLGVIHSSAAGRLSASRHKRVDRSRAAAGAGPAYPDKRHVQLI
jgi:hypothetical protein